MVFDLGYLIDISEINAVCIVFVDNGKSWDFKWKKNHGKLIFAAVASQVPSE